MESNKKRLLLTNGRSPITLYLARLLHSNGHDIYVTDTQKIHYCRFSNCVKKNLVVPAPRLHPDEYVDALVKIVQEEEIDMLIPNWEDVLPISKRKSLFPSSCKVFVTEFDLLRRVHHKGNFISLLRSLDFETQKTEPLYNRENLERVDIPVFALKQGFSRSSKYVYKVRKGGPYPPVSPSKEEEWVAQEWLSGRVFCTYTLCHEGKVFAHSTYPMEFVKDHNGTRHANIGSYCLCFNSVHHEKILKWVEEFTAKTNFTGQLAFDFIEIPNGKLYAIECNPRLTSGVTLFHTNDHLDAAFFGINPQLITPSSKIEKQLLLPMIFMGWQPAWICNKWSLYFKKLLIAKDIVFDIRDIKPFLFQSLIILKCLWSSFQNKSSIASSFTDDLDYNGEKS